MSTWAKDVTRPADVPTTELMNWVKSLSEDDMRDLLYFFVGYRPGLMATMKAEREDVLQ